MSTDVADLGIKIDFTESVKAREALDNLEAAAKRTAGSVNTFEKAWLDLVKGLAAYDILKKIATALLEAGEKALFAGEQYLRLAAIAGTTASAISAFEEPARKSGVAIETVATAIARLSRSIGEARLGDENKKLMLGALGINPNDSRDAAAIFQDVARSLVSMKDQTVASAAAFPLLGRGMSELRPLLKEMTEQGTLHARVTEEQARQSKELSDVWEELKLSAENATLAMTSKLVPALTAILKQVLAIKDAKLSNLDLQALAGGVPLDFGDGRQPVGGSQAQVRALDNAQLGGGTSSGTAEGRVKKLQEDMRLYEARIAALKGFSAQYLTAVKALAALIEADDDESVHRQENHLAKQQQLNDAALQAQIAYLEKERALAGAIGKTKEMAEFTATIAQLNAQRVADEVITSARISAIRRDNLLRGVDEYRTYIAKIENAGVDLATTQREAEERAQADRLQSLDVALKAGLISEEQAAAARLRLLRQNRQNISAIAKEEWLDRVAFANLTNRDIISINDNLFGVLAGLMNTGSRRMFEIGKAASIANALIKTYEAANVAFEKGSEINIYAGYAFMAAAIVAGLANVQKISQVQFGSGAGGGGSSFSPGVGVGVTPTAPATQAPALPSGPSVQIIINGNLIGQEDYVRNTIVPILLDGMQTQDLRLIPPQSRNAQDIRDNAP